MIVGDIGNIAILAEDGVTGVKFEYNSIETLMAALDKIEDIIQSLPTLAPLPIVT